MILEILTWLHLENVEKLSFYLAQNLSKSASLSPSQRVSDVIIMGYLFALMSNKKLQFILTFLLCEVIAYSGMLNSLNDHMYYMAFAGIYSALYHYLYASKANVKVILTCGLLILFNVWSATDAFLYPHTNTVFYSNYDVILVAVHAVSICSLINWQVLRSVVGASFVRLFDSVGVDYTMPRVYAACYLSNKKEGLRF